MQIAIIGAGIGGLTAAAILIRCGHTVRIFEQASALTKVGAGIQLSANATKVLRDLGFELELERLGVKPKFFEFRPYDTGEILHRIPLRDTHRQQHGGSYYQMHCVELHSLLVDAVLQLELDSRAIAVSQDSGAPLVTFTDHGPIEYDLLIGADGIKSVVRKHVAGDDVPPIHRSGGLADHHSGREDSKRPAARRRFDDLVWSRQPRRHVLHKWWQDLDFRRLRRARMERRIVDD